MPFIEDVSRVLAWGLVAVVLVNVLFLWVVLERRLRLQRYFVIKDAAREGARRQVQGYVEARLSLEDMLGLRNEMKAAPARAAVHELLFSARTRETAPRITELAFALHSVDEWATGAFGRKRGRQLVSSSLKREPPETAGPRTSGLARRIKRARIFAVRRGVAVSRLARLSPEFASPFLVEAAADASTEVRQVAITAMGEARHAPFIPYLMSELARSIEQGNDVSWRTLKIALTSFRLTDLRHFVPFLDHPHPRMRFTVMDAISQIAAEASRGGMLNKNDFSLDVYTAILDRRIDDESGDVRARAAGVVKHFRDGRATRALRRLLNDDNDFVRMHAARACEDRFYVDLLPDLTRRVTDPHWRVRDAAAKSLLVFGNAGVTELYRVFLETDDEETAQQITDVIQRVGGMPRLLASLTTDVQSGLATAVCQKMGMLGKTVYLNRALAGIDDERVRLSLMDALLVAPDEEYLGVLQSLASGRHDVVGTRASEILRQSGISRVSQGPGHA